MKIVIEIVPHMSQRYNTIGDWQWFGETLSIKVSEMGNWKYECLVGLHEAIETILCRDAGVSEEDVDKFDLSHPELHEPGNSLEAPYHKQHLVAIAIEEILAKHLKVDLEAYENKMEWLQQQRDFNDATPLA